MTSIETIKDFAAKVLASEDIEIGAPLVLEEVTFVPIIKHEIPRDERDYLSLSEAIDEEVCKIIAVSYTHLTLPTTPYV